MTFTQIRLPSHIAPLKALPGISLTPPLGEQIGWKDRDTMHTVNGWCQGVLGEQEEMMDVCWSLQDRQEFL